MTSPRLPLSLLVAALFAAAAGSARPNDPPAGADRRDWLESYYEAPRPEEFVSQMKDWSADGTLDNDYAKPAVIAFSSQVLRQNRAQIREWYGTLAGLPPQHMQILHTALLYSRTKEADALMKELFGSSYTEVRRETGKILELPLDKRDTMDMLWGFFYATGSPAAIRRIVAAFRFLEAPDKPEGVDVPEGYVAFYKTLPGFAESSLLANAERHPRIREILRELLESDEGLIESERKGIGGILEELEKPAPERAPE
jgi:hypothetical protein